jgi:hypothetical protein
MRRRRDNRDSQLSAGIHDGEGTVAVSVIDGAA